jgi:ABC-type multidrug transport system fused ATPase/permease subunit
MSLLPFRYQDTSISLTPGQRRQIWDALLDADMNSCYWRHLARRYYYYDLIVKAAVLSISSGTVLTWLAWLEVDWLWKALSVLAACLSATSLVLNFPARIEMMMEMVAKWTALMNAYENLWNALDTTPPENVLATYGELQATRVELTRAESRLPLSTRLVSRASREVRQSRGLSPKPQQRS